VAKWVYQTAATGKVEATPLVVDGILYATSQDDRASRSTPAPAPIWMYQRHCPGIFALAATGEPRLAVLGDKVFLEPWTRT